LSEPKCILRLWRTCRPVATVKNVEFGSLEWIMNVCSFCIKATYAMSHKPVKKPRPSKFSVVSTL
jgi:hypothetical protein